MTRNTETHFGNIPTKDIRRSKLKMPFRHLTSFNTGDIIPIFHTEVLPGDTFKLNESMIVRMTTPIAPVLDNAWIDTYYFFVPNRLVWEHWREFMGENNTDAWTQETEYTVPKTTAPAATEDDPVGGWKKGTIASYMGARINTENVWIDSTYLRAYALIYNEWFRSENVSEPAEVTIGDSNSNGSNGTDYVTDAQLGGMPCKAVKYADYFTRSLPSPQKGEDVLLPLGTMSPIVATKYIGAGGQDISDTDALGKEIGIYLGQGGTTFAYRNPTTGYFENTIDTGKGISLEVDLSNAASATINQLRQAFAVQRLAELDARGGKVA